VEGGRWKGRRKRDGLRGRMRIRKAVAGGLKAIGYRLQADRKLGV